MTFGKVVKCVTAAVGQEQKSRRGQCVEDRGEHATLKAGRVGQRTKVLTGHRQLRRIGNNSADQVKDRRGHHRPLITLAPARRLMPGAQITRNGGGRVNPDAPPAVTGAIGMGQQCAQHRFGDLFPPLGARHQGPIVDTGDGATIGQRGQILLRQRAGQIVGTEGAVSFGQLLAFRRQ